MALLERLEGQKKAEQTLPGKGTEKSRAAAPARIDHFQKLKSKMHKRIVEELGLADMDRRQLE